MRDNIYQYFAIFIELITSLFTIFFQLYAVVKKFECSKYQGLFRCRIHLQLSCNIKNNSYRIEIVLKRTLNMILSKIVIF